MDGKKGTSTSVREHLSQSHFTTSLVRGRQVGRSEQGPAGGLSCVERAKAKWYKARDWCHASPLRGCCTQAMNPFCWAEVAPLPGRVRKPEHPGESAVTGRRCSQRERSETSGEISGAEVQPTSPDLCNERWLLILTLIFGKVKGESEGAKGSKTTKTKNN